MARQMKRGGIRRKPRNKRRGYKPRRVAIRQPVQYFKRTMFVRAAYASSTVADTLFSRKFSLSDLANYTEFTSLYDQYKIKAIKFTLLPRVTEADVAQAVPTVSTCIDLDDNTAPSSIDDMVQYQNFRMTRGNVAHTRYWKPAVSSMAWNSGVGTAYTVSKNLWIDVGSSGIPYFGIKGCIQQSAAVQTFDLKVDFYMAFKNVR